MSTEEVASLFQAEDGATHGWRIVVGVVAARGGLFGVGGRWRVVSGIERPQVHRPGVGLMGHRRKAELSALERLVFFRFSIVFEVGHGREAEVAGLVRIELDWFAQLKAGQRFQAIFAGILGLSIGVFHLCVLPADKMHRGSRRVSAAHSAEAEDGAAHGRGIVVVLILVGGTGLNAVERRKTVLPGVQRLEVDGAGVGFVVERWKAELSRVEGLELGAVVGFVAGEWWKAELAGVEWLELGAVVGLVAGEWRKAELTGVEGLELRGLVGLVAGERW